MSQAESSSPEVDVEGKSFRDLHTLGGKSYGLQDYALAVLYFSKASEIGVKDLEDQLHDDLGDIYLLYGKSLLELVRQEGDPLGEDVPKEVAVGAEEAEEEEDEDADDGDDKEKGEGEDGNASKNEGDESKSDLKDEDKIEDEKEADTSQDDELDNSKNEEIEGIELNGEKISSNSNSEKTEKEEGEEETAEDEEPSDLQLAWEVLELAKLIFTKRGEKGKFDLADTLITLGEISMESENVEAAITDIKQAVALLETVEDKNNRMLAEAYYKLGMAVAMENKVEEAVEFYNKSKEVLVNRIKDLESSERVLHKREVEEMKKIVPEIEEKVVDLRTFREEQLKKSTEDKPAADKQPTNVQEPEKKANDITHLVKRKRKSDVDEASGSAPSKKPALD